MDEPIFLVNAIVGLAPFLAGAYIWYIFKYED